MKFITPFEFKHIKHLIRLNGGPLSAFQNQFDFMVSYWRSLSTFYKVANSQTYADYCQPIQKPWYSSIPIIRIWIKWLKNL